MSNKIRVILFLFIVFFQFDLFALEDSSVSLSELHQQKMVEQLIYESYLDKSQKVQEVIGYHVDYYFHPSWYAGIAIHGVTDGLNSGGFGIASFGIGCHYPFIFGLEGDTKLLIGSGGGGGIRGGGGFMTEFLTGVGFKLTPDLFLNLKVGYLSFPTGFLKTSLVNIGLSYQYNRVGL